VGTTDAFHFVWKQVSGDVSLAASFGRMPVATLLKPFSSFVKVSTQIRRMPTPLHGDDDKNRCNTGKCAAATRESIERSRTANRIEREGDAVSMSVVTETRQPAGVPSGSN
jgi:hypothetical protein